VIVTGGIALTDVADSTPYTTRVLPDIESNHLSSSGRGSEQRGEHTERRRLARAVRTKQRHELTGLDVHVERGDRLDDVILYFEMLREPGRLNHRRAHDLMGSDRGVSEAVGFSHDPLAAPNASQLMRSCASPTPM
jgi:hypothetical protein